MSKCPDPMFARLLAATVLFAAASILPAAGQSIEDGKKVFNKCIACHAVGDGAKNKVGPQLNNLFSRTAGTLDGYNYSNAMKAAGEAGVVWDEVTLTQYLVAPRKFVKGTKMAFAGLRKSDDVANVIAYLKSFDEDQQQAPSQDAAAPEDGQSAGAAQQPAATALAADAQVPEHGTFHLGRVATDDEIAAWDIDIRPDGTGLPEGSGTVSHGEEVYTDNCAVCHGDFGEAVGRWPVLAGGQDTLTDDRPVKTIGSYWPHLSTVYDYVRRAMPFGGARTLSDDDVYALTAYLLYLNDIVDDEEFELSKENFTSVEMPNAGNFIEDDRLSEPAYTDTGEPCMSDCKGEVKITMRARVLDVTPDAGEDDENSGAGSID